MRHDNLWRLPRPNIHVLSGLAALVVLLHVSLVASVAWSAPGNVYGSDVAAGDPCSGVPKATESARAAVHSEVVLKTLECLSRLRTTVQSVDAAHELFRRYDWSSEHPAITLSVLSDVALREVIQKQMPWLLAPRALRAEVPQLAAELQGRGQLPWRGKFTAAQLDELVALSARFRQALGAFRRDVLAAMGPRLVSFEREERSLLQREPAQRVRSRIAWLLSAYRAGSARASDAWLRGVEVFSDLGGFLPQAAPADVSPEMVALFLPYIAVPALSVNESGEEYFPDALTDPSLQMSDDEQPLRVVAHALSRLLGSRALIDRLGGRYLEITQREDALSEEFARARKAQRPPQSRPVRVAFMDSGVDPETFPTFKPWLSLGARGHVFQGDFADGDPSPWVPFEQGEFLTAGHGSSTLSIFSTVLAEWDRTLLDPTRIDVGMWKVQSTRQALIANSWGRALWNVQNIPFYAIQNAMSADVPANERPQIVSASMYFPIIDQMALAKTPRLIADAPWLWVMASGNNGRDVSHWGTAIRAVVNASQGPSCFDDVPKELRNDARILCVGGASPGVDGLSIAPYSNTGSRVDVYASVFQNPFCNRGTSCATPVITAAATVLQSQFPRLQPEQIKRAIVDAAVKRELPVCEENGLCPQPLVTHVVRYFDPKISMPRAIARAKEILLEPAPSSARAGARPKSTVR